MPRCTAIKLDTLATCGKETTKVYGTGTVNGTARREPLCDRHAKYLGYTDRDLVAELI